MANIFDLFREIETEKNEVLPITHLVVGLGNPGKEYLNTRHNAGFMAIDVLAKKTGVELNRSRFQALTGEGMIAGKRVLLMKPQTYMNRSGESVRDAVFYKIPAENIVILWDDIQLDVGKLRIRRKGSDGGQKGLRDIIYQMNTDAIPRIRMGVGKVPQGGNVVNWVLGNIPENDREEFFQTLMNSAEAVPLILEGKIDEAMCRFN